MLAGLFGEVTEMCRSAVSNRDWTRVVKFTLAEKGREEGYYVCSHGVPNAHHGEWLYDVTWLEVDDDKSREHVYVRRVALAAESEWGNHGDIVDDFNKLLAARADRRVIIFQARSDEDSNEIRSKLEHATSAFRNCEANDTIYLVNYREDGARGERFEISQLPGLRL